MTLRKTKIVATLGPSSNSEEMLARMITAGVNVVRLNFSHGSAEEHIHRAAMVRAIAAKLNRPIGVLCDLQGPKIRIGRFELGKVSLKTGDVFILDADCELGNQYQVGLDYKTLPQEVAEGVVLLLDDGRISMQVDRVKGNQIHCLVLNGGVLSNNKGINRQGGGLSAEALTKKDRVDIKTAVALEADFIAMSFPKTAADVELARSLVKQAGGHASIIAKIERAEAIDNLAAIIEASDAIMVARGDLGVEVGDAAVPGLQKRMIRMARAQNKLVITATQMMESMISSPIPTRAEVSDVANAVLDGTDAVMLSAETAAGKYPLETVLEMAKICAAAEHAEGAEHAEVDADFTGQTFTRIDQSIAMGALFTAQHLGAKAIVALTDSGSTALWMSRHSTNIPIYALTSKLVTQRRMALYRNVRPLLADTSADRDTALMQAETHLKERGIVKTGDVYAITCGEPMGSPGGTNMLKICRVG